MFLQGSLKIHAEQIKKKMTIMLGKKLNLSSQMKMQRKSLKEINVQTGLFGQKMSSLPAGVSIVEQIENRTHF
jgi:hypothetical protein